MHPPVFQDPGIPQTSLGHAVRASGLGDAPVFVLGAFIWIFIHGLFMLAGCTRVTTLQQSAKVVLGGVLVWLIAGTDIFARLCAAIPAGEASPAYFTSLSGFLAAFAPPYTPAVLLLPFTLGIVYLIRMHDTDDS